MGDSCVPERLTQRAHAAEDALPLGEALRLLREPTGLSARALSLASGLSSSYVGKIENGTIDDPSFRAFARIVSELNLTAREVYVLVKQEAGR